MTRPFQYDNFVQSQIAVGSTNISPSYAAQPQSNHYLDVSNGNQSRLSLKQKINELLNLCKDQNQGIKAQFAQVIGAEKQIYELMKQEIEEPPRFNNYARSNVQMFPGTQYVGSGTPSPNGAAYEQEHKPQSHKSFPFYPGVPSQYGNYYQPADSAGVNRRGYEDSWNIDPYSQNPNQRAHILKSKVQELKEQNNRLRGLTQQFQQPQREDQDEETRVLQRQIARLRQIVQDYESELNLLNSNSKNNKKAQQVRQLKDQGEKIRQDTLAMLRNKSTPIINHQQTPSYGSYGSGQYGPQLVTSGYYENNINSEHQIQIRAQLNELRAECEQLQNDNTNIKRMKGTATGSRRF